jgi:hypothetical protein
LLPRNSLSVGSRLHCAANSSVEALAAWLSEHVLNQDRQMERCRSLHIENAHPGLRLLGINAKAPEEEVRRAFDLRWKDLEAKLGRAPMDNDSD